MHRKRKTMDEKEKIKAILDRDSRYDGVFWYGVKSTGIVCKPSCNAKIPLLKNIKLFNQVEDAIRRGYRPCKICMKVMEKKNIIRIKRYASPCGVLMLSSFGDKLCLCDWQAEKHRDHVDRRLKRILRAEFKEGMSEVIEKAERQLDEFFAGQRREFDVPLLFVGTDFQKTVWNELLKIPFGQTISYDEMARRIGMPDAVRAVANANGANSMSIFVPCHRVIGSDRSLTGYGGGLNTKRMLLELEGVL